MHKKILNYAYEQVSEDNKLIRLATLTTIIHSLIFVFYILYQIYFFYSHIQESNSSSLDLTQYMGYVTQLFGNINYVSILIIAGTILAIGYFLIPPIAEAILIYYVDSKTKSGRKSIGRGIFKFFPMFEYHSLFSLFNFLVFIIFLSRFYVLGVLDNPVVIFIVILRFLLTFAIALLMPYAKFFIVLQNKGVRESVSASMNLAFENIGITFRFVAISYFLYIRFIINMLLIIGIPSVMLYFAMKSGYDNAEVIRNTIYGLFIFLILLSAYINGIIEAFFATYWYKVYSTLINDEEELETTSNNTLKVNEEE